MFVNTFATAVRLGLFKLAIAIVLVGFFGSRASAEDVSTRPSQLTAISDQEAEKIVAQGLPDNPPKFDHPLSKVECSRPEQRRMDHLLTAATDQDFIDAYINGADFDTSPQRENNARFYLKMANPVYEASGARDCEISRSEAAAISFYTNSGYIHVNAALRGRDELKRQKWSAMIKLLNSALEKLAPYEGFVRRFSNFGESTILLSYSRITFPSFLNTTRAFAIGIGGVDRLLIHSESCRDIRALSLEPQEYEVLCLPNTTFEIRSAQTSGFVHKYLLYEVPANRIQ